MGSKVLFSSDKHDYETPDDFFAMVNSEFKFTLDVCADAKNAKVKKYYSKRDNGLSQEWHGRVWCNPPYGSEIVQWVEKADSESKRSYCKIIVMLLPVRSDTKWFHNFIYKKVEIRFIKGRLRFKNTNSSAPFPSMLAIWNNW